MPIKIHLGDMKMMMKTMTKDWNGSKKTNARQRWNSSMAAVAASTMIKMSGAHNCGAIHRNYLGGHYMNGSAPHMRSIHVKCMAVQPKDQKTKEAFTPSPTTAKEVRTKLGDVFSFSGPAPEIINGRLAMVGFVSAIGVELVSGSDLFSQLTGEGLPWFVFSAVLFTAASLVPMLNGITAESKSQEIMSSSAEMWNGRFAMLGLVALALTEYVKGGPLV